MLDYVEDYLLQLFKLSLGPVTNPVRLARYDVPFVQAVADQLANNTPLTAKQLSLSKLIIMKYERQLQKKGIVIDQAALNKVKLGIRVINPDKTLELVNGVMHLRFPYHTDLIDELRAAARSSSKGRVEWNKATKVWEIALTEPNVIMACTLASVYNITVSPEILEIHDHIRQYSNPFFLCVQENNDAITIVGAEDSLAQATSQFNTLSQYADHSTLFGYSVPFNIQQKLEREFGPTQTRFMLERESQVDWTTEQEEVFAYISQTNRFPAVFIGGIFDVELLANKFAGFNIYTDVLKGGVIRNQHCVILKEDTIDPNTFIPKVIVSDVSMLFGVTSQRLTQDAEKILWTCKKLK